MTALINITPVDATNVAAASPCGSGLGQGAPRMNDVALAGRRAR